MKIISLVLCFLVWFASPLFAYGDVSEIGGLDATPQSMIANQRLQFRPSPVKLLQREHSNFFSRITASNYWVAGAFPFNTSHGVIFDAEITELNFGFNYGITDDLEFGINLRFFSVNGGILDEYIEWFHGFFNLPNAAREYWPRNKVVFWDTRLGANEWKQSTYLNDLVISKKWAIVPKTLILFKQIRIPIDSQIDGAGFLVGAQLFGQLRDCGVSVAAGVAWHEDVDFFQYQMHNFLIFAYAELKARLEPNLAFIVALHMQSPTFENTTINGSPVVYLNQSIVEIHTGIQYIVSNMILQLAIIENLNPASSADIGFHFSITLFDPR